MNLKEKIVNSEICSGLFNPDELYRLDEIGKITKYSASFVKTELRTARIPSKRLGNARKNYLRFLGKDLNTVFALTANTLIN